MRVCIRVDSSISIGSGHVMRCLALADELKRSGFDVIFISRAHSGNLIGLIESKGYQVVTLSQTGEKCGATPEDVDHASLLGVTWQQDADETIAVLEELEPEWLIIDHYAIDTRWEQQVRPYIHRLMVIDDLANRCHDCDLLLDQNLYQNMEERYANLVPNDCLKLLGPTYALLRPEFAQSRATVRERSDEVKRLLVCYGGTDPTGETLKALKALHLAECHDLFVDVVAGASNPDKESVRLFCEERANTEFHYQTNNMAMLMANADVFIGAGGSTVWERCCLGLPGLITIIADNQRELVNHLASEKILINLGWHEDVSSADIAQQLQNIIQQPAVLKTIRHASAALVDGLGTQRVSKHLDESFQFQIKDDIKAARKSATKAHK